MDERRRNYRIQQHVPVSLSVGAQRIRGVATNLSPGGLCVSTRAAIATGARVRGRVGLPGGDELDFEADVRWSRKHSASEGGASRLVGLEFWAPPDERYYAFLRRAWDQRPGAAVAGPPPARAGEIAARALAADAPAPPGKPGARRGSSQGGARKPSPVRSIVPGLRAFSAMVVGSAEWAQLAGAGEPYLGAAIAALLIERAASQAVHAQLPRGVRTLSRETEVSLSDHGPIAAGATVVASAVLSGVGPDYATFTFDGVVLEGGRTLAAGRHVRTATKA